jgi:hypothetical protein
MGFQYEMSALRFQGFAFVTIAAAEADSLGPSVSRPSLLVRGRPGSTAMGDSPTIADNAPYLDYTRMTNRLRDTSPSKRGRILAAFYLFLIVAGISAQAIITDRLVVSTDATKTASNIIANKSLYRLGYMLFMLEMVAQVVVSMMFYDLLKPVNRSVARLSAILGFTGCGIKTMARLFYYAPLILLSGASYLSALQPGQAEALSLVLIKLNYQGAAIGIIFFAFEVVLRGWLWYNSGFLPRFLGVLWIVSGLGWLTYLWPPLGSQAFVVVALFAIATIIATSGWLFFPGVDDAKWRARASLALASEWT